MEAELARLARRALRAQRERLLEALGEQPEREPDEAFWQGEQDAVVVALQPTIEQATQLAAQAHGAHIKSLPADPDIVPGVLMPVSVPVLWDEAVIALEAVNWARVYVGELVRKITDNTRSLVRQAVAAFMATPGMTIGDLRRMLEPAFGETRAQRIAVTETTRAFAEGQKLVQNELRRGGLRLERIWRTSTDERVCTTCGPLEDRRESEGWTDAEDGPPAHVNCILPGNRVTLPGRLVAGAQSFYVGGAIEVRLANGGILSVTKNHPILTPGGWVAAHLLSESDQIFYCANPERVATAINPDDNNVPTAIEQVWSALKESPSMAAVGVPASAEDLHGDGRFVDGNVDIIYPRRLLLGDGESTLPQGVGQPGFDGSDMAEQRLVTGCSLAPLGNRDDAAPASFVSSIEHSGAINFRGAGPADIHAIGHVAGCNIALQEASPECAAIDAGLASEFLLRFSGEITLQKIVQIRDFNSCGHVYDLQCEPYGLYITEGAIVKNCRCWTVLGL